MSRKILNPVIPGFHPDPSVCRVGDEFFLVTSSFEYFPGVPVFQSRDLVHWRPIGHCLTRPDQLDLAGLASSQGIWAPSIRYHRKRFYMVTTLVGGQPFRCRNFFVTSEAPEGPWSDPVWLDEGGIDPDLVFAPDGRVFYVRNGKEGIWLGEIDISTGEITSPMRRVWRGTGGSHPEGPHLYHVAKNWYLMIAEGGTGEGHMETIARSADPYGPWEPCPHNPILTHSDRPEHPLQCTGHADIFADGDGRWWAVFLAVRHMRPEPPLVHLGRETCLAPVTWTDDGWPVIGEGGRVELSYEAELPPPDSDLALEPVQDDFDATRLRFSWNFRRNPDPESWSLEARPSCLRLSGTPHTLSETGPLAFVGRRQRDFECRAETQMEFRPEADGDEAGLAVISEEENHFEAGLRRRDGRTELFSRVTENGKSRETPGPAFEGDAVILGVEATRDTYRLYARPEPDAQAIELGQAASSLLKPKFTGTFIGLYATGNGRPAAAPADFDWFVYEPAGE
jgi:alpha-N-arabinofuranosidase